MPPPGHASNGLACNYGLEPTSSMALLIKLVWMPSRHTVHQFDQTFQLSFGGRMLRIIIYHFRTYPMELFYCLLPLLLPFRQPQPLTHPANAGYRSCCSGICHVSRGGRLANNRLQIMCHSRLGTYCLCQSFRTSGSNTASRLSGQVLTT